MAPRNWQRLLFGVQGCESFIFDFVECLGVKSNGVLYFITPLSLPVIFIRKFHENHVRKIVPLTANDCEWIAM